MDEIDVAGMEINSITPTDVELQDQALRRCHVMLSCLEKLATISNGPAFSAEEDEAMALASQCEDYQDPGYLEPEVTIDLELLTDRQLAEKDLALGKGLIEGSMDEKHVALERHMERKQLGLFEDLTESPNLAPSPMEIPEDDMVGSPSPLEMPDADTVGSPEVNATAPEQKDTKDRKAKAACKKSACKKPAAKKGCCKEKEAYRSCTHRQQEERCKKGQREERHGKQDQKKEKRRMLSTSVKRARRTRRTSLQRKRNAMLRKVARRMSC